MADNGMTPPKNVLPLIVKGGNGPRPGMYETIALAHRQFVEVKWRAQTTGEQLAFKPEIMMYFEESIAFLAEELLRLRVEMEKREP